MKILPLGYNQNTAPNNNSKKASFGMKLDDHYAKLLMNEYLTKCNRLRTKNEAIATVRRFILAAERGNKDNDGLRLISFSRDDQFISATILDTKANKLEEIKCPSKSDLALMEKLTEFLEAKQGKKVAERKITQQNRQSIASRMAAKLILLID